MTITLNADYDVTLSTALLGYVGETNARPVTVEGMEVDGADRYVLTIDYGDGTVYDVDITDGTWTPTADILRVSRNVSCQISARKYDNGNYTLVKKSKIFSLRIGQALSDGVAPIPSPSVAADALDRMTALGDRITADVQTAQSAAETATTAAENAEKSATTAGVSADTATQAASRAETAKTSAETSATQADASRQGADTARQQAVTAQNNAKISADIAASAAQQTTADKTATAGYAETAKSAAGSAAADRQAVADMAEQVTVDKETVVKSTARCEEIHDMMSDYSSPLFVKNVAQGEKLVLTDTAKTGIRSITLFGKSTQAGTPTLDNPIDIVSCENPTIHFAGKNLLKLTPDMPFATLKDEFENTTKRIIKPGEIAFRLTANNYFSRDSLVRDNIGHGSYVDSKSSAYGLGVGVALEPGKTYRVGFSKYVGHGGGLGVAFYGSDGTHISYIDMIASGKAFTVPDDVTYSVVIIRGVGDSSRIGLYDIYIVSSDETSDYQPYVTPQSAETIHILRGVPVLSGGNYTDANGQQWVSDTLEVRADGTGKLTRYSWIGTLTGSEAWQVYQYPKLYYGFSLYQWLPFYAVLRRGGLSNQLEVITQAVVKKGLWLSVNDGGLYAVNMDQFYDDTADDKGLAAWKKHLSEHPLTVLTFVDTPTVTDLTAEEVQKILALHTYDVDTIVTTDCGAGIEVQYVADSKKYIDEKFAELSAAIVSSASENE